MRWLVKAAVGLVAKRKQRSVVARSVEVDDIMTLVVTGGEEKI